MAKTVYQEGWDAYGIVDIRKCPYTDEARRAAWLTGHSDHKLKAEND